METTDKRCETCVRSHFPQGAWPCNQCSRSLANVLVKDQWLPKVAEITNLVPPEQIEDKDAFWMRRQHRLDRFIEQLKAAGWRCAGSPASWREPTDKGGLTLPSLTHDLFDGILQDCQIFFDRCQGGEE